MLKCQQLAKQYLGISSASLYICIYLKMKNTWYKSQNRDITKNVLETNLIRLVQDFTGHVLMMIKTWSSATVHSCWFWCSHKKLMIKILWCKLQMSTKALKNTTNVDETMRKHEWQWLVKYWVHMIQKNTVNDGRLQYNGITIQWENHPL